MTDGVGTGAELARPRRWPVRVGLALVVAVYLVYSSFGIAAPLFWGHHGYHAGTYMLRAKMTLRFGLFTPATHMGYEAPPPEAYYFHHPMGYHHVLDLPILLLGDREWVARGVAVLGGLLTLWALYVMVRRHWSREAGLLALAVYVALPILCSFSVLVDPMLPAMACSIAVADRFLRYLERPNRRDLLAACAFTALGGFLMWEAYFQALFHALSILLGALLYRRRGVTLRDALRWCLATGAAASAMMGFHLGYLIAKDFWQDFLTSFRQRHEASFAYAADRHKQWLEILYGWPLLTLGLLWLLLFIARLFAGRARRRDLGVLLFFQINTLYVWLFATASAIHLYRVFWFSTFFALAVTDLVVDLRITVGRLLAAWPRLARPLSLAAAAAAVTAHFATTAPHALANLIESREMAGTHGQVGYNPDHQKLMFAQELARRTKPEDYLIIHDNIPRRVEFTHYADRSGAHMASLSQLPALTKGRPRVVVALDPDLPLGEHRLMIDLLRQHPGYRYDRYLMIDLRSHRPGLHEYTYVPQPADWKWRWFSSHKYPPLAPQPINDAFLQCAHAVTEVAPPADLPPPVEPGRDDWGTCFHNALVLRGDARGAAAFVERLRGRTSKREVAVGELARVVALRVNGRVGADLWMRLERLPAIDRRLPADLVARWRLEPLGDRVPAVAPIVGEAPLGGSGPWAMTPRHLGYLYFDTITWSALPGRYHLRWEIGRPTPPPPPVVTATATAIPAIPGLPMVPRARFAIPAGALAPGAATAVGTAIAHGWHPPLAAPPALPPPPPPLPPPPLASADLGEIEIR